MFMDLACLAFDRFGEWVGGAGFQLYFSLGDHGGEGSFGEWVGVAGSRSSKLCLEASPQAVS